MARRTRAGPKSKGRQSRRGTGCAFGWGNRVALMAKPELCSKVNSCKSVRYVTPLVPDRDKDKGAIPALLLWFAVISTVTKPANRWARSHY
jgi:hypothetical protein